MSTQLHDQVSCLLLYNKNSITINARKSWVWVVEPTFDGSPCDNMGLSLLM